MQDRDQQISINIFDQINLICHEFRRGWKDGKRPRMEEFLSRVNQDARTTLFSNLLQLEIRYREILNERPTSADYLKRFPNFSLQIRQAFDESTSMSVEPVEESPAFESADFKYPEANSDSFDSLASGNPRYASLEMPAARRIGDYELIRELGRGGMGVVYEARHVKQGNRVALKTLPTGVDGQQVNAERLHRFRKEFRSLSEINHPNLVGMQTLEVDGGQWFFTMDLINAVDFLSFVRPYDELDEARLRNAVQQLVLGISELHRLRIVHRDLKPSNVLVDPNGRVSILDFGLVAEMHQVTDLSQTRSGMFAGTPRYAAPEQMFGQRSEASDWYALGVMLFEALTGQVPYVAKDQMELMRQKHQEDPPLLSERDDLPSDLAKLVDGLIQREPKYRLTTSEIVGVLGIDLDTVTHGSTAGSEGSAGSLEELELEFEPEDEILIGREEQLAQLEVARQELVDNREPAVVWISGKSGEGKSSLVEKFLKPLRNGTEMLVLSSRCYDRESVPFKVIDSLIDPLVQFLRSMPEDEVSKILPNDIEMLAHLFPIFRRVKPVAERSSRNLTGGLDEKQIRNVAFAAFRDLVVTIGQRTPIVLFVDDLQWGDADSAEVIHSLLIPPGAPALIFLGSFRSDEVDDSPFMKNWSSRTTNQSCQFKTFNVQVEPLSEKQCREFLQVRFGTSDDTAMHVVSDFYSSSQGNPYFLEQLIEGFDSETNSFQSIPLNQIIDNRLSRCPNEATRLLDVISIAGKAVPIGEVSTVAGHSGPALATITHMRSERLVRLIGSLDEQLVDTYHDKIREVVLEKLDAHKRRDLHSMYGAYLERGKSCDDEIAQTDHIFDLAHHFLEAGDPRAFQYQLSAGEVALNTYAMENALNHLNIAKRLQPEEIDPAIQYKIDYLLGKSLSGCNQLVKAIVAYRQALESASSKLERAHCFLSLGHAHWRCSEYDVGYDFICKGFAELGERLPRTLLGKVIAGSATLMSSVLIPKWASLRLRNISQSKLNLLAQSYAKYNQLIINRDIYVSLYFYARGYAIAKHVDDTQIKAESFSNFAGGMQYAGLTWIARRSIKRAQDFAPKIESELIKGAYYFAFGGYLFFAGKIAEAVPLLNKSSEILNRTGDYRRFMAEHFLWHSWSVRGNSSLIVKHAKIEELGAKEYNDQITIGYGLYGQAEGLALQGHNELALNRANKAIEILTAHKSTFLLVAYIQKAKVQLHAGDYEQARKSALRAIKDVPKMRFVVLSVVVFPLFVEATLANRWFQPRRISRRELRRSAWATSVARFSAIPFPVNGPYALRVSGRLATARGYAKKAIKCFDRAIASAKDIGSDYEHARSLIDKSMLNHPNAPADRERGLKILENLGCVLPDPEIEYLDIEREAHHARAAEAREQE